MLADPAAASQLLLSTGFVGPSYSLLPPLSPHSKVRGSELRPGDLDTSDAVVLNIEERLRRAPLPPYRYMIGGATKHNETADDVLEWLLYHVHLGFEHFVLYGRVQGQVYERLRPLLELGWLTLMDHDPVHPAFPRFQREWQIRADRLLYLETDEYLAANDTLLGRASTDAFLPWLDREYGDIDSLVLPRVSFTSNGHYDRPTEGVLASYVEASELDVSYEASRHLSRVQALEPASTEHRPSLLEGYRVSDAFGELGGVVLQSTEGYPLYVHKYAAQSWEECTGRKQLGEFYCRRQMQGTAEHAARQHHSDHTLARLAPSIRLAQMRYEQRYPPFALSDFTLSTYSSSPFGSSRTPLSTVYTGGETLVIDSVQSDVGYLEVVLKSAGSVRYLPVVYHEGDNSASFILPTVADAGSHELIVTRQYASSPDPAAEPVSQCSVVRHIASFPDQRQLQELIASDCKHYEPSVYRDLAASDWAHPLYRGDVLFHRFFDLRPASPSPTPPTRLSPSQFEQGRWQSYPLDLFNGDSPNTPRLYTCDRCAEFFSPNQWGAASGRDVCGDEADMASTGFLRWTPDVVPTFLDSSLTTREVRDCLEPSTERPKGLRVVLIGDSVAWHSMLGLACMANQVGLSIWPRVRHHNFQYEMFDMIRNNISAHGWEKLFSWDFDEATNAMADGGAPDAIVFNVGIWAATWGNLPGYASGLRKAFTYLRAFADKHNIRIFWRETTSLFPRVVPEPLYQVNPRVEPLNAIANALAREFSIPIIPTFAMTRPRTDAAHDNAHTGPLVQGELAEQFLYAVCKAAPE
ncbi:hypothetical protein JCM10207_007007 [Rhodosporidiobolus poonsookiae]